MASLMKEKKKREKLLKQYEKEGIKLIISQDFLEKSF
jgi:hypothetical protein